ncbi:MAG TPA: hypothetical protein VE933_02665, partial [Chitinophagaceae bacterium]|nr:hypothetical protein [Chitinophagaceae bacterium]
KPKIPVFTTVEVTKNGSTITAPDLTVIKNNKQGSSTIRGKVFLQLWESSMSLMLNSYYVHDQDVYIISKNGDQAYFDDYKTSYNGEYIFDQLPIGDYSVFTYSVDTTGVASSGSVDQTLQKVPVFTDVSVTSNNTVVTAPDITIIKIQ